MDTALTDGDGIPKQVAAETLKHGESVDLWFGSGLRVLVAPWP